MPWPQSHNPSTETGQLHSEHKKGFVLSFGPGDWFGSWMNRQQLLSRLANKNWLVVYSAGALSIWDREKPAWRQAPWLTTWEMSDGVHVMRPGKLGAFWPRLGLWERWAKRMHLADMLKAAGSQINRTQSIAYIFNPKFYPYIAGRWDGPIVYHVYDALSLTSGWNEKLAQLEALLVERADLIIAVTEQMADLLPQRVPEKTRILPNGADVVAFAHGVELPCPPDLAAIPGPRIGYVGNVTPKVDLALVADLAKRHPKWQWVFVGRVLWGNDYVADGGLKCKRLSNVHFLGEKPHNELPSYVGHMDVNIMCYRTDGNGWWKFGYPLKMHEYLAAGKPVVSANIESVRPFAKVMTLAGSVVEWEKAIDDALKGRGAGTLEDRRRIAWENSWDERVNRLDAWLTALQTRASSDKIHRAKFHNLK